jgi:hypothetical protein
MMSEHVRVVIRRPRGNDRGTEVVLVRDRRILAVLKENDEVDGSLIGLLHAPARQLQSRAEWLHTLAATAQEHPIIDAIIAYRMDGEHLETVPQPLAMSQLAAYPAANAGGAS